MVYNSLHLYTTFGGHDVNHMGNMNQYVIFSPQFRHIFSISNPPLGPKFSYNVPNLGLGYTATHELPLHKQWIGKVFQIWS